MEYFIMKKSLTLLLVIFVSAIIFGQAEKPKTIRLSSGKKKADTTKTTFSNYSAIDYISRYSVKDYEKLLDSLKKYNKTNFYKLRMAYTVTPNYNPLDTVEKVLFAEAEKLISARKYTAASGIVDSILKRNFLSLNAHLMNCNLLNAMRDSVRSDYHSMIFDGLAQAIKSTGNGEAPKSAFIVISTDEEIPFLTAIGVRAVSRKTAEVEGHHFAIYDVKSRFGKEQFFIYFNIDIPFKYEQAHAKKQ
jgi:hypothetical protein